MGTAADRRIVSDFRIRENLGTIGIRFDGEWGRVRPSLTLAWIEALSNNDFEMGVSASNGMPLGVGLVESPYSGLFHIGAGLRIDLGNDWSLTPSAHYQNGGDETAWNLQVGIGYGF
jgi:outer membrane autotransporter protein